MKYADTLAIVYILHIPDILGIADILPEYVGAWAAVSLACVVFGVWGGSLVCVCRGVFGVRARPPAAMLFVLLCAHNYYFMPPQLPAMFWLKRERVAAAGMGSGSAPHRTPF